MFALILFLIAIAFSLISQTPTIVASGGAAWMNYFWALPFLYLFISKFNTFGNKRIIPFYIYVVVFSVYCIFCEAFSATNHYVGNDFRNLWISLLIISISFVYYKNFGNAKILKTISSVILLCCFLLGINLYMNYFIGYDISEREYVYGNKNSIGQIFLSSIFLSVLFFPKSKIFKWLSIAEILCLLILIFLLKARATILCFVFCFTVLSLILKDRRLKIALAIIIAGAVTYLISNPNFFKLIINDIILNSSNPSNLDQISSGRVGFIGDALKLVNVHLMFGSGEYYVDCMPINILVEYGIVGLIIISLYLYMMVRKILRFNLESKLNLCALIIFLSYMLNSLFEAYPPFGPGVKCFMLWMILGFAIAQSDMKFMCRKV